MGYFQDDNERKSMMRLLAFMGFWLGAGVAISGLIGWFLGMPDHVAAIVIAGIGLAGGGELGKVLQKKFEK